MEVLYSVYTQDNPSENAINQINFCEWKQQLPAGVMKLSVFVPSPSLVKNFLPESHHTSWRGWGRPVDRTAKCRNQIQHNSRLPCSMMARMRKTVAEFKIR